MVKKALMYPHRLIYQDSCIMMQSTPTDAEKFAKY